MKKRKSKIKKVIKRVIIMGAAGRDFFNFFSCFKNNSRERVVCFTATQIPNISNRNFPSKLAGKLYPKGIPIYPEERLEKLIKKFKADEVVFAYSDISHEEVMHKASQAIAAGADFKLMGEKTMLSAKKPVVAVCAVRTGSGKSQTARKVAAYFKDQGLKVAVLRHPMPYGNLIRQEVERIASYSDLKKYNCTIEEREEYEPHLKKGVVVYAGVNYEKILSLAEQEADIIIWDGGNNDIPFICPDLWITVADPHRPGHELTYYPGEINFRKADVIIINKVDTATENGIATVEQNAKKVNPKATIIKAASPLYIENAGLMRGKRVIIVEDGPTLTHGGMKYGAGTIAAIRYKGKIIDPKKYAVGSIKKIYQQYDMGKILPAMGYGKKQLKELQETINKAKCDVVVDGTPTDLRRLIKINKPIVEVDYELEEVGKVKLKDVLKRIKIKTK